VQEAVVKLLQSRWWNHINWKVSS